MRVRHADVKEFARRMISDHRALVRDRKDREDVRKALDEIRDPELKAWAQDELRTVEEHLRMAEEIDQKLR